MDPIKRQFISNCSISARIVAHPFPDMAACEAALESAYGQSLLAIHANNLFGMKAHVNKDHPDWGTIVLPTKEFLGGEWKEEKAVFERYPTLDDCFADRLNTLTRLSSVYPNYKAALEATTPEDYVTAVSKTWSTDPNRATKVILIYREYVADSVQPA
jgi:flagellum-specific peptidoglycan hydrolase FlgJ